MKVIIAVAICISGCQSRRGAYEKYLHARIDTAQQNLLHEQTVLDAEGRPNPYRRRLVEWEPTSQTYRIVEDRSPFKLRYDPGHPLADANGNVKYPNVDRATEELEILVTKEELARSSAKRPGT